MIYEYPKTPFTVFASHAPSHLGRQPGGNLHVGTISVFEQSQNSFLSTCSKTLFILVAMHLGRQAGDVLHIGTSSVLDCQKIKNLVRLEFLPKNENRRLDIRLS